MLRTIKYTVYFDSPLMIGSMTTSPGVYDRMTTMDDGLPYVPASSMRGRVKDAIRTFLQDNMEGWKEFELCIGQQATIGHQEDEKLFFCTKNPPCALCRIFGAPGGINRRGFDFSGAYYSADATRQIKDTFGDNMTGYPMLDRRPRNRVDAELRRVKKDHFFMDGVAALMSELHGIIKENQNHFRLYENNESIRKFDYRLLLLGMRLVGELGASRNRGYGKCEIKPDKELNWHNEIEIFINSWMEAHGGIKE